MWVWGTPVCAYLSGIGGQMVSAPLHAVAELRSSFTRRVNLSSHIHSLIHHFHIPQSALHPSIRPTICHFVVCLYILASDRLHICLSLCIFYNPGSPQTGLFPCLLTTYFPSVHLSVPVCDNNIYSISHIWSLSTFNAN